MTLDGARAATQTQLVIPSDAGERATREEGRVKWQRRQPS